MANEIKNDEVNKATQDSESADAVLSTADAEVLEELSYLGAYQEYVRDRSSSIED